MDIKLSCTLIYVVLLPLHISTPNQILVHVPLMCLAFNFIVRLSGLVLVIVLWCRSWTPLLLVDSFKETAPRRLKLDHLR
jgi:hypothetical protein